MDETNFWNPTFGVCKSPFGVIVWQAETPKGTHSECTLSMLQHFRKSPTSNVDMSKPSSTGERITNKDILPIRDARCKLKRPITSKVCDFNHSQIFGVNGMPEIMNMHFYIGDYHI